MLPRCFPGAPLMLTVLLVAWLAPRSECLSCDECAAGEFKDKSDTCVACPSGFFQDKQNQTECDACPIGWKSQNLNQSRACTKCPSGKHTNGADKKATCQLCPEYQWSESSWKVTHCKDCPAGYSTWGKIRNWCVHCPKGRFNNKTKSICEFCPSGFFQDRNASTKCKECDGSSYSDSIETTKPCEKCPAGYYILPGSKKTKCEGCERGFYSSKIGAQTEWPCFACMTRPVFKNSSMNPRISTSGRFITSSLSPSQLWFKGKETSWSYIGFPFVSFIERTPKDPIKRNYTIFPRGQYRFADEDWSEHSKLQPNETKEGCKYCPADDNFDI